MLHKFKKIDVAIVLILLLLMVISTFLLYSATMNTHTLKMDAQKMTIIYSVSLFVFVAAMIVDYRVIIKYVYYVYGFGLLLLVLVFFLGIEKNGARGWFKLPFSLEFQPVELVKIIIILTLAAVMAKRKGNPLEMTRDVLPLGLITLVPVLLVASQPDLGNALIICVILIAMYWIGNMRMILIVSGIVVIGGGAYLFLHMLQLYHVPLKAYLEEHHMYTTWITRLMTLMDPSSATQAAKMQVENSIRAIGSGLLTGEGYLQGSSVQGNRIPIVYTDAIFVVVGEEFGFRGSSVLLLLYFILIYRMILIALYCKNHAGTYIVIGVVAMLVYQIFQNIGMMIGIMPLTGITLPFISYGGTSLMINMLAMGLVMSVRMHDDILLEDE